MKTRKELLTKFKGDTTVDSTELTIVNFQGFEGGHRALITVIHHYHTFTSWFFTKLTDEEQAIRELECKALSNIFNPDDFLAEEEKVDKKPKKKSPITKKARKEVTVTFNRDNTTHINLIVNMLDTKIGKSWRDKAPIIKEYNNTITGKIEMLDAKGDMLESFQTTYLDYLKGLND